MFSGGDEDVSKYGDVDSDEKIRERLVSTKNKVAQEEIIKILSKKICELQEEMRIKDSVLSELQLPAKWYDNIPKQGVLCWVGDYAPITKNSNSLRTIVEYDPDRLCSFIMHRCEASIAAWVNAVPLTNEEIEEFKR